MTEKPYGICGVYCGRCPSGNGRVRFTAGELKRLVDTCRYDWLEDVEKSFSFMEFRRGLEWFSQSVCAGCLAGGGAPCKNRPCMRNKGLRSCLQCEIYMTCPDTAYQRDYYPVVAENYERVKQVGFESHLEEEEERAKAGVNLMSHLERRCYKRIKLDDGKSNK